MRVCPKTHTHTHTLITCTSRVRNAVFADVVMKHHAHRETRTLRWYRYLNKRRAEDKMLDEIAEKLSATGERGTCKEDRPVLLVGDWSREGRRMLKGWTPVRNVGMLRKLATRYHVFLMSEHKV